MLGRTSKMGQRDIEHSLFIVLEHKGQHIDHLPVAAGLLEQVLLQRPEGAQQIHLLPCKSPNNPGNLLAHAASSKYTQSNGAETALTLQS